MVRTPHESCIPHMLQHTISCITVHANKQACEAAPAMLPRLFHNFTHRTVAGLFPLAPLVQHCAPLQNTGHCTHRAAMSPHARTVWAA
jgi:hypothetical protein